MRPAPRPLPGGANRLGAALGALSDASARLAGWVVAAFTALTLAAGGYVAEHLRFNTDTAAMLSAELPFRQQLERYKQAFPQFVDNLVLVVDAPTPERAAQAADALATRMSQRPELFADVHRPFAGPFFARHGLLYLDRDELHGLADRLAEMQPFLTELADRPGPSGLFRALRRLAEVPPGQPLPDLSVALSRLDRSARAALEGQVLPVSWQRLLRGEDAGGPAREIVIARPQLDYGAVLAAAPAIREARRMAADIGIDPGADDGVRLRVTGEAGLAHDELRTLAEGAAATAGLVVTGVLVVLWLALRSARLVAAVFLALACGLVLTAAFAALAVGRLNLISVAFAMLYVGLGVDFAIHLTLAQQQHHRACGERRRALRDAARRIGPALGLCALTTAVGFYAFLPTAYAGVAELGLIAGTGMFISLGVSLVLLPALVTGLRVPCRWHEGGGLTAAAGRMATRRPRPVILAAAALAVVAGLLAPQARFDHNPLNLRDPDSESVAAFRELLAADQAQGWNAVVLAEGRAAAQRSAEALAALATVDRVIWLESFVPGGQPEKLAVIDEMGFLLGELRVTGAVATDPAAMAEDAAGAAAALHAIPGERAWAGQAETLAGRLDAVAGRLLDPVRGAELAERLRHGLTGTLGFALERLATSLQAGPLAPGDLPHALVARWRAPGGLYRIEAAPAVSLEDRTALRGFVGDIRGVAPAVTGTPVVMLEASQAVLEAFRQAFLGAVTLIALLLLVALRSIRLTLLVLVPLLLGGLLTAAGAVLLGIPFNFANVIALPLLLGAGVDYGVHSVGRFRAEGGRAERLPASSTARAVLYSALTTVVGFGNLALASHPGLASMGVMLTLGILLTLATTLLVLPALLSRHGPPQGTGGH